MDKVDTTLKRKCKDLLRQIYANAIIFSSTNESLYEEFANMIKLEFEMSMMENSSSFSDFKSKQTNEGTFIRQSKYTNEIIYKF